MGVTRARTVVRFNVEPDGSLSHERVLVDMSGDPARGSPDGIKVDRNGNLFFGGAGGLWIASADGTHLGTILSGRNTNLAFGDADGRGLDIMAGTGFTRIRLNAPAI